MHHRAYDPRLGHFTTPDFRAPDIYDPTTFTEPYAYAGGNPIQYFDENGLERGMLRSSMKNDVIRTGDLVDRDPLDTEKAIRIIQDGEKLTPEQIAFLNGLLLGAATTGVIVTLPISATTLIISGSVVAVGSGSYSGYQRVNSGQTTTQAILGGISDGTGTNYIYGSVTNKDLVTQESLNLTSEELSLRRGSIIGSAITAPFTSSIRQGFISTLPSGKVKNKYLAITLEQGLKPTKQNLRNATPLIVDNHRISSESLQLLSDSSQLRIPGRLVLFGPYHRRQSPSQTEQDFLNIVRSGQLWGRGHKDSGLRVNSFNGNIPESISGFEFFTDSRPSFHPQYAYWHSGNKNTFIVDEQTAGINIVITKISPDLLKILPLELQEALKKQLYIFNQSTRIRP